MKLTKSQFCSAVNTYCEMLEQDYKYSELLNISPEWGPGEWIGNYYQLLSDLCELEVDIYVGTTLDWFCYDADFGRNKDINKIFDGHKTWRIDSPEILYDYIMEVELEEY